MAVKINFDLKDPHWSLYLRLVIDGNFFLGISLPNNNNNVRTFCRSCLWEESARMVLLRRFYNIVKHRLHVWSRHNIFYQNRDNNTRNKLNQNLVFPITSFSCWVLGILCTDLFSFTADASGMADVSPPLSPAGEQHGQGEMRQKIICYITRLFPPTVFCCPWNRNRTHYSEVKSAYYYVSEKQNLFSSSLSGAAKVRRVAVCVLMSPLLCGEQLSAGCWVLVAGGCTCLSQQNEPAPTNYSWQRTFAKLHSARRRPLLRPFSLLKVHSSN